MKACNYCGRDNEDDAVRCLACQSEFTLAPTGTASPDQAPRSRLPRVWLGMLLTVACAVAVFLCLEVRPLNLGIVTLAAALWIAPHVYWVFCVHRLHKVVREITNGGYGITPMQAVVGNIVPVWNLYWAFAWTSALDRWCGERTGTKPVPGLWGGLILVGLVVYTKVDGMVGAAILLVVIWVFNRKIRAASRHPQQPPHQPRVSDGP